MVKEIIQRIGSFPISAANIGKFWYGCIDWYFINKITFSDKYTERKTNGDPK